MFMMFFRMGQGIDGFNVVDLSLFPFSPPRALFIGRFLITLACEAHTHDVDHKNRYHLADQAVKRNRHASLAKGGDLQRTTSFTGTMLSVRSNESKRTCCVDRTAEPGAAQSESCRNEARSIGA
jgi:hypothetical protein